MKTRTTTAILLTLITLMSIGTAFALTNNSYACLPTCITPQCEVIFTYASTWDNEIEKDVGHTCTWITNCQHTIQVSICNAYPCYEVYINYTVKNIGTCTIHFDSVTIINPNPEALAITTTNHTCTWLSPWETVKGTTTVHTLQPAQQNGQYTFQIKIGTSCQTKHPCSMGFWKNQFSTALCKNGKPQVPAATLEQYLDQINATSQVFEFTGTRKQKFQQALTILSRYTSSSMEAKLKAHLLALRLNYVAGWTDGYKLNGKIAWDIIQGSEYALLHNLTSDYGKWKNLCDQFNNLGD